ncbi:MAG: hypothetical protein MJ135_04465, partial [Oscillospiraceae bacterium]|nr:hypothetical protein [Oscillospiraceae bacterium]
MILKNDSLFYLNSEALCCILRLTGRGQLELIHFGSPVEPEDAEALACKQGTGWGCSTLPAEDAPCLDVLPLAWSSSGKGDYRESPIELENCSGPVAAEFHYVSHRVLAESVPMECSLPQAKGNAETLELSFASGDLLLKLYFTLMGGVLLRRSVLENHGSQ